MHLLKSVLIIVLISLVSVATPTSKATANPGSNRHINTTVGDQLHDVREHLVAAVGAQDYPRDPYQMRVPHTTTTLVFGRYGPSIDPYVGLNLIAGAQYQMIQHIVEARGDGPASDVYFQWVQNRLYIEVRRLRVEEVLTWLMLADMLEGVRLFFRMQGWWFETAITLLDDTAGLVASGQIVFK